MRDKFTSDFNDGAAEARLSRKLANRLGVARFRARRAVQERDDMARRYEYLLEANRSANAYIDQLEKELSRRLTLLAQGKNTPITPPPRNPYPPGVRL